MDIVAVTVWDEEEVSILDGEKLNPVICGFVVSIVGAVCSFNVTVLLDCDVDAALPAAS